MTNKRKEYGIAEIRKVRLRLEEEGEVKLWRRYS